MKFWFKALAKAYLWAALLLMACNLIAPLEATKAIGIISIIFINLWFIVTVVIAIIEESNKDDN